MVVEQKIILTSRELKWEGNSHIVTFKSSTKRPRLSRGSFSPQGIIQLCKTHVLNILRKDTA
jgi:hypothetical protein